MRSLLCASLLLAAPHATTQSAPTRIEDAIKHEGIHNSKVMDYLDHLTNSIGHRLTGSDNFDLACKWAKSEFEKMGLSNVHLHKWGEWQIRFNRGQWAGRVEKPVSIELQVATEAWTAGTKGQVTGKAIKVPNDILELEERWAGKVAGAWLFARKSGRRGGGLWNHLKVFAADEGAAGLVYSSAGDARYPNRIRVFGSRNMALRANSKIPALPEICVRKDQYEKIEELLESGEDVAVTFDIRNRFRREPVPLYNVIADIPGTEKPDEYVMVGGHLDSWHQATGTTDNGTGTTSTMEAARILAAAGARPKRTIRFCLWGGEEQGLLGSRAYVLKNRQDMSKVSCYFNHDTGTNWANGISVPPDMYEWFQKVLAPVMSLEAPDPAYEGDVFRLGRVRSIGGGRGGSDHASFLSAGVPAWSWRLTGRSNYFQHTWHSQWDSFDVAIPEYQRHTSTVIALAAYGVANLPELLPRDNVGRRAQPREAAAENKKTEETKAGEKKKEAASGKKKG